MNEVPVTSAKIPVRRSLVGALPSNLDSATDALLPLPLPLPPNATVPHRHHDPPRKTDGLPPHRCGRICSWCSDQQPGMVGPGYPPKQLKVWIFDTVDIKISIGLMLIC